MIKFKALIHKETGTVISYEDWKEGFKQRFLFRFKSKKKLLSCDALYMITHDDFEIIYESEFTTEELKTIWCCLDSMICKYPHARLTEREIKEKVLRIAKENENIDL